MSAVIELPALEDTRAWAEALLNACADRRVFTFQGQLGAGKTTLIKALCSALGVESGMGSPSFSIVNEYRTAAGDAVYHFDLYRLRNAGELDGIGFTEYLDSGHYCFVEWPELAMESLPPEAVNVRLRVGTHGHRTAQLDLLPAAQATAA